METANFIDNEKEFLIYFLDTYKYPGIKEENPKVWHKGSFTEIIANPYCDQQCSYCYIHRHGKELYPLDTRAEKEVQVKHLKMLLDYFIAHKVFIPNWEIYGGDLFHDGIFWDLMDVLAEKYDEIYAIDPTLFDRFGHTKDGRVEVVVPNNMSYFRNDEFKERLRTLRDDLYLNHHIILGFSWSTDGKYAVDSREKKLLSDEYWDDMLSFARSIEAGLHPMIAPENVKYWCENYDWWLEMFEKHNFSDVPKHFQPPMLEVRNPEWTDENLTDYMKFLKHMFDIRLNRFCDGDIDKMAYHYFVGDGKNGTLPQAHQMDPLKIYANDRQKYDERLSCSMQDQMHIVLSDMAIVPCHRLAYEQFRGGYFKFDDEKITGIRPLNPSLYITAKTFSVTMLPKCFNCDFKLCCMNSCLGANFEKSGELFVVPDEVCRLLKVKYGFIIKMLNETGVLQHALDHNYLNSFERNWYITTSRKLGYKING